MTTTARWILFGAPMIRALLDGHKTQTRRIVKPQLPDFVTEVLCYPSNKEDWWPPHPHTGEPWQKYWRVCPYGRPGDLLWVRETWCQAWDMGRNQWFDPPRAHYRADADHVVHVDDANRSPWRPSIHMPRWASRLTLRITDVRVERLQDIREDDAHAEGVSYQEHGGDSAREGFQRLWESINGPGAWADNPFVWALTFDIIHANVDTVIQESKQ